MAKAATKGAVNRNVPATQPKREVGAPASSVPAYMAGKAGKGLVGITDQDLEMPRVYILSSVHEEVNTHEDARPGMIWHNVLERALAGKDESLPFVPILITKAATLWRPRTDGNGGILARCNNPSDPDAVWTPSNEKFTVKLKDKKTPVVWDTKGSLAESGLLEWGTSDPDDPDSQPAGTISYRILAAFPTLDIGLAVITCQRGSVKPAKKLLSSIRMSGAPSYGLIYNLASKLEQGPTGDDFYNISFTGDGFVPEDKFAEYEAISKAFAGKDFYGKGEEGEASDRTTGGNVGKGDVPNTKGKY